jgi:hypothetical protein
MQPTEFPGSVQIAKPVNMTDEECMSVWAACGVDESGYPYFVTAWKPNYEDLKAIQEGRPIYVKTIGVQLPPMALFTFDENNNGNF